MGYSWRRMVKDSRIAGRIVYYVKHGLFPEMRVVLRKTGLNRLKAKGDYDSEEISSFKMKHRGQSCFIIGNGPSLRLEDLEALHHAGIYSFGANRIADLFPKTKWRPTYMCAMEHGFLGRIDGEQSIDDYVVDLHYCGVEYAFINEEFRSQISSRAARSTAVFVRCPLSPLYTTALMPFSDDASLYVSDLGSVTHFAIQLACYMGFERIYLYGVDNTYGKFLGLDGQFHIIERTASHAEGLGTVRDDVAGERVPRNRAEAYCMGGFADMRKSDIGYRQCFDFAAKHGIEILNATYGGNLNVFSRISFQDALKRGSTHE